VFESRKDVLQGLGLEAYLKASALMLMPPAWISANDRALSEQHRAALAAASAPIEVMTSRIDAIVRHDQRARLGEIRLPALVIVAQDDMITPRFYSDELASRVPGAKLVVLDGGGHFAPIAAADSYNRAVGGFLRGLLGR